MARSSPLSVRVEKPEGALGEVMNEIRSWLDSHNIQPTAFRTDKVSRGALAFDICFAGEHEARLFEQAFSTRLIASGNPTTTANARQSTQPSESSALTVDDLLITDELEIRAKNRRSHNRATVSALQTLTRDITEHPSEALQRLVDLAQQLCGGGSAGISVYEPQPEGAGIFRWTALTGRAAQFNGETTPRDFSPCGICLDKGETILMDRPGRYYDWLNLPDLPLTEAVLVPLFVNGTDPFGTLWVMSHGERQFDSEDARVLSDMASVVGLALSLISGIADKEAMLSQTRYQSSKLEALGQLAGGIAHDFNNVLTVLSGQLEIIRNRTDQKNIIAMVDRGLESASHGEMLVKHLMAFARREPLRPQIIDSQGKLREIVEMLTVAIPMISVNSQIADDLWPVLVDPSLLEAAILNLGFNARDAMPGGGILTVAARNIRLDKAISGAGLATDSVAISVADAGTGMTPDVLEHAFEPFFTTKDAGKGTGLGLSMVHDFAVQFGGTATIQSEVGRGTSITIYLPRAERPSV
jgi:signal transduction histidine kinase